MQQEWNNLEKDIILTEIKVKLLNCHYKAKNIELQHIKAEAKVKLE